MRVELVFCYFSKKNCFTPILNNKQIFYWSSSRWKGEKNKEILELKQIGIISLLRPPPLLYPPPILTDNPRGKYNRRVHRDEQNPVKKAKTLFGGLAAKKEFPPEGRGEAQEGGVLRGAWYVVSTDAEVWRVVRFCCLCWTYTGVFICSYFFAEEMWENIKIWVSQKKY